MLARIMDNQVWFKAYLRDTSGKGGSVLHFAHHLHPWEAVCGLCVSRPRPLCGNRDKAVAHPRAQHQRTALLKLFLGLREVVKGYDMQRLSPS